MTVPLLRYADREKRGSVPGTGTPVGHWTTNRWACDGACSRASVLLCAPTPGTEILTGRIPVGSQNGDSVRDAAREDRAGEPKARHRG
ncbi:hypothetical protein GCM10010279_11130 [Streptomyces mutabilis]|nr:hypothetical protein GCM10010279_11130 [Streptomyces mutabilis]